ncbi:GFA family protein [Qipengyuania qiaonensis]|uniref:GFA family protein n=1 Tax=Qipengyuania qiaonensis TaxID=2867240 RepID=A0ABS7J2C7_9SPHN|nr:GFA family protein [Qipengyuania qiaonensis]MBX7481038.1 GFA family protein [Qipengyuania qiaonensis]
MKGELSGGCLCGAVRYTLREGFRLNPYACHCTDCQSRTGTAFSEHMLFALADLDLTGEMDVGEYDQPSGAHSRIFGCAQCKSRIYAVNDRREGMASLRCGTLDESASIVPAAHLWVTSKQPWIGLPANAKAMDEQPQTNEEWISLVGIASR